jgi:regulator of sigma E protease
MGAAINKTWDMSLLTLRMLGRMLVGKASLENLSGPLTIAQFAGQAASAGLIAFLSLLALVSISLGVLNLLPVPVLDGGHLLYYLIEGIKGSPLSEAIQHVGQQVGIVVLLLLMGLALFNDFNRLLG